jgi:hypothetical protein
MSWGLKFALLTIPPTPPTKCNSIEHRLFPHVPRANLRRDFRFGRDCQKRRCKQVLHHVRLISL